MKAFLNFRAIVLFSGACTCFFVHADTHYVSPSGSHTAPYTNWVTASTNIQSAVAAASGGDTVLVTNGTYTVGLSMIDIRLESVNGPEATIAQKTSYGRCFWLKGSSVLSGFTVTNGDATGTTGGGVFCDDTSQVVTNCIITGNIANDGGGMYRGTAYNCTIVSNTANNIGGGMLQSVAVNCTISGNMATNFGGGMYDGTATDCLIIGNTADAGGGMINGDAFSCTISGNIASTSGGGLANGTAANCLIVDNTASSFGGGMNNTSATNCTVIGNAAAYGGGLASGSAYNCIIWYNSGTSGYEDLFILSASFNTCSFNSPHGSDGNITNAPAFLDYVSGNYRLAYNSLCINAGENSYVNGGSLDFDGTPRIKDGLVDMGVYEYDISYDSDGDSLSDYFETAIGLDPMVSNIGLDTDGDGRDDLDELADGFSPTINNNAYLETYVQSNANLYGYYDTNTVLDLNVGDIGMAVSNGMANLSLQMEVSDNLSGWTNAGDAVEWSYPVDADKYFFRVRAEP